jgi:hypothetical protein
LREKIPGPSPAGFSDTDVGRQAVARAGFDVEVLPHLLHGRAGFIKLEGNANGFTDIVPCFSPKPPQKRTRRPILGTA